MRDSGNGRVLNRVTDGDFQVVVGVDQLMSDWNILEFVVFAILDCQIPGCTANVVVYETIALFERPIQDEVYVSVH